MSTLILIILSILAIALAIGLFLLHHRRPWPREQHPSYFAKPSQREGC